MEGWKGELEMENDTCMGEGRRKMKMGFKTRSSRIEMGGGRWVVGGSANRGGGGGGWAALIQQDLASMGARGIWRESGSARIEKPFVLAQCGTTAVSSSAARCRPLATRDANCELSHWLSASFVCCVFFLFLAG